MKIGSESREVSVGLDLHERHSQVDALDEGGVRARPLDQPIRSTRSRDSSGRLGSPAA